MNFDPNSGPAKLFGLVRDPAPQTEVLFKWGLSRALVLLSHLVWSRANGELTLVANELKARFYMHSGPTKLFAWYRGYGSQTQVPYMGWPCRGFARPLLSLPAHLAAES